MGKFIRNGWLLTLIFFGCTSAFASQQAAFEHNEKGHMYMKKRQFRNAIREFEEARKYAYKNKILSKNLMIAYNNYGFDLRDKGEYALAVEQFENAVHCDDRSAYPYYNLGQTYYLMQNMPKAKEALYKAYKINPALKGLKDLLKKVKQESIVEKGYHNIDTMHFVVSYSDDSPVDKLSYIKTYLEDAYGRVGMFMDYYSPKKTIALVYPEESYKKLLRGTAYWSMSIYDGKIRVPASKFDYTTQDIIRIIYHEYAHVLVDELAKRKCPNWFSEGVAGKAEEIVSPKDRDLIKKYVSKYGLTPIKHMPLNIGNIRDVNRATMMYIQSYLIVDFIYERKGASGIKQVLLWVGKGMTIEKAIERLFSEKMTQFEQKWKMYVIDKYRIDFQ